MLGESSKISKYKSYYDLLMEFLSNEVIALCGHDRVFDLFRNFEQGFDDFEKLNKQLSNHLKYKYEIVKKERIY